MMFDSLRDSVPSFAPFSASRMISRSDACWCGARRTASRTATLHSQMMGKSSRCAQLSG